MKICFRFAAAAAIITLAACSKKADDTVATSPGSATWTIDSVSYSANAITVSGNQISAVAASDPGQQIAFTFPGPTLPAVSGTDSSVGSIVSDTAHEVLILAGNTQTGNYHRVRNALVAVTVTGGKISAAFTKSIATNNNPAIIDTVRMTATITQQ